MFLGRERTLSRRKACQFHERRVENSTTGNQDPSKIILDSPEPSRLRDQTHFTWIVACLMVLQRGREMFITQHIELDIAGNARLMNFRNCARLFSLALSRPLSIPRTLSSLSM